MNAILRHPRAYFRRILAFTFIELMIVMALIATLTAIVLPLWSDYTTEARILKGIVDIRLIEKAIAAFERETGRLPDTLDEIEHLTNTDKPDAWGRDYVYQRMIYDPDKPNQKPKDARKDKFLKPLNTDYDLYSVGKDGETNKNITAGPSLDDIIRAADGEYVGLASEF